MFKISGRRPKAPPTFRIHNLELSEQEFNRAQGNDWDEGDQGRVER